MTQTFTTNFKIPIADFDQTPWHTQVQAMMQAIDNIVYNALVVGNTGNWVNSHAYTVGQIAIDSTNGQTFLVGVSHTSAAGPTTFAQDRAAHPSFWQQFAVSINPRGQWTHDTAYSFYDWVYDTTLGIIAICTIAHTSNHAGTINDDIANWKYLAVLPLNPTAVQILYDHTASGLAATNIQAAVDEIVLRNAVNLTTTGLLRWKYGNDQSVEGGGNSGSNFFIDSYNDGGTLLAHVFNINRATGVVTFSARPSVTGSGTFGDLAFRTTINTADINALQVTNAKIADATIALTKLATIASGSLLGNFTGGAAVPTLYTLGANFGVTGTVINNLTVPERQIVNLKIAVTGNTSATVTADEVIVKDATGNARNVAVNSTLNLAAAGGLNQLATGLTITIDKEYHVWAVSKADGSVPGCMVSDRATADATFLTQLSGIAGTYTLYTRLGPLMTAHGSAILYGTLQQGRTCTYVEGVAAGSPNTNALPGPVHNGLTGTYSAASPSLIAKTVQGAGFYVPSTAIMVRMSGTTNYKAGGGGSYQCAPSASYSGTNNGPGGSAGKPWPISVDVAGTDNGSWIIVLESVSVYIAATAATASFVLGWEENVPAI